MALATWWRSDALPELPAVPGFRAALADDDAMLAELNRISIEEVRARRQDGHRPYVGYMHNIPVTYGWVATRVMAIGELNLTLRLPAADRYLWDFATLPAWQGRGLYPRLLQAILRQESRAAERFWIIYAPENLPSGAGMRKAGFAPAAELSFDSERRVSLAPLGAQERARAAADLLGVPLVASPLSPCWCCASAQPVDPAGASCWPASGQPAVCTCAIQPRPSGRQAA